VENQRSTSLIHYSFIFILLSQESNGALLFWMNPHLLRSCLFRSFMVVSDFLPLNFSTYLKPPSRDNHCKVPYPRMQQCVQRGYQIFAHLDSSILKTNGMLM